MSKIDEVRADMVKAMKAGEKEKKDTLSLLLAALKNKAIDKRADLTPEEETQVIMKEIKQTKETLELTPADRTDIIEECRHDLICLGVKSEKTIDEKDPLILGAVRCFARWKFGLDNDDAPLNREDYFAMRDELRKRVEYCTFQTK